jgi:hypothetical protein
LPISYCKPENPSGIVLWMPYLGGDRETYNTEMQYIAAHNYT